MLTVVNEPQAEYNATSWKIKSKYYPSDDFIFVIEDQTIKFYPPIGTTFVLFSEKPKQKLSELRGKLSKQSNQEIDAQILDLRKEWERNI